MRLSSFSVALFRLVRATERPCWPDDSLPVWVLVDWACLHPFISLFVYKLAASFAFGVAVLTTRFVASLLTGDCSPKSTRLSHHPCSILVSLQLPSYRHQRKQVLAKNKYLTFGEFLRLFNSASVSALWLPVSSFTAAAKTTREQSSNGDFHWPSRWCPPSHSQPWSSCSQNRHDGW